MKKNLLLTLIISILPTIVQSSQAEVSKLMPNEFDEYDQLYNKLNTAASELDERQAFDIFSNITTSTLLLDSIKKRDSYVTLFLLKVCQTQNHLIDPADQEWIAKIKKERDVNARLIEQMHGESFVNFQRNFPPTISKHTRNTALVTISAQFNPCYNDIRTLPVIDQSKKVLFLLEQGANPRAILKFSGLNISPVHTANSNVLEELLKHGGNAHERQPHLNQISLIECFLNQNFKINPDAEKCVELLLKYGATIPENLSPLAQRQLKAIQTHKES